MTTVARAVLDVLESAYGTGDGAETRTITAVGSGAATSTALVLEAASGDGTIAVGSVAGYVVGAPLNVDTGDASQRTFGFFCRSDREFDEEELAILHRGLVDAHRSHARPKTLTAVELETLGLVKNGLLMKEIASLLGVSESAIKQRLKNVRLKLNAKTGPQAAAKATMLGMI